jgi:hypothetical protein
VPWDISVEALVYTEKAEQVSRGCSCCGTAFALPKEGGQVVSFAENGALSYVKVLGNGIKMKEATSKFKVGVGDGSIWVTVADQICSDVVRPLEAPEEGLRGGILRPWNQFRVGEPNSSSTTTCCIMVTNGTWVEWDELSNTRGTAGDVLVKPAEIVKGGVDRFVEGNASLCLEGQGILHCAEQVS